MVNVADVLQIVSSIVNIKERSLESGIGYDPLGHNSVHRWHQSPPASKNDIMKYYRTAS